MTAITDTRRYIDHLNNPEKDLASRFDDVLIRKICDWLMNPFTNADVTCQEEPL